MRSLGRPQLERVASAQSSRFLKQILVNFSNSASCCNVAALFASILHPFIKKDRHPQDKTPLPPKTCLFCYTTQFKASHRATAPRRRSVEPAPDPTCLDLWLGRHLQRRAVTVAGLGHVEMPRSGGAARLGSGGRCGAVVSRKRRGVAWKRPIS